MTGGDLLAAIERILARLLGALLHLVAHLAELLVLHPSRLDEQAEQKASDGAPDSPYGRRSRSERRNGRRCLALSAAIAAGS